MYTELGILIPGKLKGLIGRPILSFIQPGCLNQNLVKSSTQILLKSEHNCYCEPTTP